MLHCYMLQEHYNLNISQLSAGVIEYEEVTLTRNCAVLSNVFLTIIAIVFFNSSNLTLT